MGVKIGPRSLAALVDHACASIAQRRETFVFACANPHSLVVAGSDEQFRRALNTATAVVADGVGCQWAATLTGVTVGPRITGMDFFLAIMAAQDKSAGRVFFFGSRPEILATLRLRVAREFPRVDMATLSPPFGTWSEEQNRAMIAEIRAFRPDVLWVGMTAPKQEKWVSANEAALQVPVIGSIGAVFDYYAGATKRAPRWVCDIGMEWLYRLPREPRRLWRRTFVSGPLFLWSVLRERMLS
jgi:N-acetylglucosaminyldiphosphoundecaprenol N-acetyl-beta-D-mannosaminyltransferase